MRIGYNTWSIASVPYTTFIPALAEIGFGAIAISVVPGYTIGGRRVHNAARLEDLSVDDRRRIKTAFKERELQLSSVVGNQSLVSEDPAARHRAFDLLCRTIDLCTELAIDSEVPTMNTGTGGTSGDLEDARIQPMIVDALGALSEYAAARGVMVCVEPHVGAAVDTIERWRRLQANAAADDSWYVAGNDTGRVTVPDGSQIEFQFVLGGEGTFDLVRYLQLVRQHGFMRPIAFEASVQCQARPDYDALAAARSTYRWMADAWRRAGVTPD